MVIKERFTSLDSNLHNIVKEREDAGWKMLRINAEKDNALAIKWLVPDDCFDIHKNDL